MIKEPRLQFSEEERADPDLKDAIKRADKAAAKADKANAKLPKKKHIKFETDDKKGTVVPKLITEEKKPPSKLSHSVRTAPLSTVSNSLHKKVREDEDDNVGVESAHNTEEAAEEAGHVLSSAHNHAKTKAFHKSEAAEHRLERSNINALYQKSMKENPNASSNPISKMQQKQAIKRQYAQAKKSQQGAHAVKNAPKAAKKAAEKTKQVGQAIWRHRKGIGIIAGILVVLSFMLNAFSSCSMMFESVGSAVAGSTYASADGNMLGAEGLYSGKEQELKHYLDTYEQTHDYDEYYFDLDEIKHDPYVLTSILSAIHSGEWTLPEVENTLQMLFDKQYILTENVDVEVRYRTETRTETVTSKDPETGEVITEVVEYEEEVPYNYYICHVTLENFDLSHVPVYIMNENQLSIYAMYMATLGNRPDLFPQGDFPNASIHKDYQDYDVPPDALADEQFAGMLHEAEKYLGYPYVWGGSNPSTSFDCSGYVCWVINHSGWNVGRISAQMLCNLCTPVSSQNVKPGDLVFFKGTYDTPGVSHVGIYVGNNVMIHCGNPISYTNLNSKYWQQHFYTYGRLP